jgi:hypothetical protein
MITLATLSQATAQEVFTQGKDHLLKQGKKSVEGFGSSSICKYRANGGELKCAAGIFIADEEYQEEMDKTPNPESDIGLGTSWLSLIGRSLVPDTVHNNLISELQSIHDNAFPEAWPSHLKLLAKREGLIYE